jgi:hypothetical protein
VSGVVGVGWILRISRLRKIETWLYVIIRNPCNFFRFVLWDLNNDEEK